jgi:hypothetical protein
MVKEHGFEIQDLFGKARNGKGIVAVKYRDPQNAENTWTGRGRMPRWMVAATKGGKAKREDFLAQKTCHKVFVRRGVAGGSVGDSSSATGVASG